MEEKRVIRINDLDMAYTELFGRMLPKMKIMDDAVNNDEDALFRLQMVQMVIMLINDLKEMEYDTPSFDEICELIGKTDFFSHDPNINGFFIALLSLLKLERQGDVELSETLKLACNGASEVLAYMGVVAKTGKYKRSEW